MFFYPKNPPNCIPILPCPLPYHFAFLDHLWSSPCYQHPPLPLHIHLNYLSGLSTPCLIHPIPLPLPPFSLFFNWFMDAFCMYFYPILSMHVHTWYIALNTRHLTAFLGCYQLPGWGKWFPFGVGYRPLKSVQILMYTLWYMLYGSPIADMQWLALW